ncbi:MAG: hypothetical protein AAF720_00865 [Pseudomonadota bacterium]
MNEADFVAEIAPVIRNAINAKIEPIVQENTALRERVIRLEARLDSLPEPQPGADGADGVNGRDGINGKDADEEAIHDRLYLTLKQSLTDYVDALPKPKDGRDGVDGKDGRNGIDGKDGVDGIGLSKIFIDRDHHLNADYTDGRTDKLSIVVGRDGVDGKDADTAMLDQKIAELKSNITALNEKFALSVNTKNTLSDDIQKIISALNIKDGKSAFDIAKSHGFEGSELEWLESLNGKDGLDGKDGRDGVDGQDGKQGEKGDPGANGADGKDGAPGLNGVDGKDGAYGQDGKPGADGKNGLSAYELALKHQFKGTEKQWLKSLQGSHGKDGVDGKNGVGLDDAYVNQAGDLITIYTDGKKKNTGHVMGPRGEAGWGFDDFEFEQIDDRNFELRFVRGDLVKVRKLKFATPLFKNYEPNAVYERGDMIMRNGCTWIAVKDNPEPFKRDSEDWKMASKKGRDGRDGKDGVSIKGDKGEKGDRGRDLTQKDHDGNKW